MVSIYFQSLQFHWFSVIRSSYCCYGMKLSTWEGDGKCSEDNVAIGEGIRYK